MAQKKILIIDDEKDLIETLTLRLETYGYKVISAPDGVMGLKLLQSERPDLVLLDVMMPKMDGYAVCRSIKNDPLYANTKVLMLSAKALSEDKRKGEEAGCDYYVTKPFDGKDLVKLIEGFLK